MHSRTANPFRLALSKLAPWTAGLVLAGGAVFGIFTGCASYVHTQDQIWAGYGPAAANNHASQLIARNFGLQMVMQMKDFRRTQSHLGAYGHQIWLYRFVGPEGVKYCLAIWQTGGYSLHHMLTKECTY